LSPFAKEQIANSRLSLGHAKILASLSQDEQDDMVRKILNESLNVRETQSLTQKKSNNIKPSNGFKIESVAKNSIKNYFKNRDINVLVSNNKITFDIKNEESIKKFMNFFID
jgi:ParB family chromosome partitioning protein